MSEGGEDLRSLTVCRAHDANSIPAARATQDRYCGSLPHHGHINCGVSLRSTLRAGDTSTALHGAIAEHFERKERRQYNGEGVGSNPACINGLTGLAFLGRSASLV